jgi:hypothetical protein
MKAKFKRSMSAYLSLYCGLLTPDQLRDLPNQPEVLDQLLKDLLFNFFVVERKTDSAQVCDFVMTICLILILRLVLNSHETLWQ